MIVLDLIAAIMNFVAAAFAVTGRSRALWFASGTIWLALAAIEGHR